jgi:hypothetical protein
VRLLVTGSRHWHDWASVGHVLELATRDAYHNHPRGRLIVVNGMARSGLDDIAAQWVKQRQRNGWPVETEPHPADWNADCVPGLCKPGHRRWRQDFQSSYCPAVGNYRNERMVRTMPDRCHGFLRDNSRGTRDCIKRAREAGIPTEVTLWENRNLFGPY